MNLRKYTIGDVIKEFANDDMATWADFWARPSLTFVKGELYDPENYMLIPRPHHLKRRIEEREKQLAQVKNISEMQQKHYDQQIKDLQLEIDQLKEQLSKSSETDK